MCANCQLLQIQFDCGAAHQRCCMGGWLAGWCWHCCLNNRKIFNSILQRCGDVSMAKSYYGPKMLARTSSGSSGSNCCKFCYTYDMTGTLPPLNPSALPYPWLHISRLLKFACTLEALPLLWRCCPGIYVCMYLSTANGPNPMTTYNLRMWLLQVFLKPCGIHWLNNAATFIDLDRIFQLEFLVAAAMCACL